MKNKYESINDQIVPIQKFSLINNYFAIFDTKEDILAKLFLYFGIRFYYTQSFVSDQTGYEIRIVRIPKWQTNKFIKAMEEYPKFMHMHGYSDYLDFCSEIFGQMFDLVSNIDKKEQQ